ncbi:phosphatases II [Neoconidiobolus thromboides FSU 785]|nr:phosphatases II [Neoconidiobolus thromboides FSU 785]
MEHIKVTKVNDVSLLMHSETLIGTLHLTPHHLIFSHPNEEKWVTYSLISSVQCLPLTDDGKYPLEIKCHHFLFFVLSFKSQSLVLDAFDSIKKLTCIDAITSVYAFYFEPRTPFTFKREQGWKIYEPMEEFRRMGIETNSNSWRFTTINSSYNFSPTYPSTLVVPTSVSDAVLKYACKYRSKCRLPVLTYLHPNGSSITRCSQPLLGIQKNRSYQDERLIQAIFETKPSKDNLIVDARPGVNAMANQAIGAGSENMDFYPNCKREFMGIENIHVVRESLNKLNEAICIADGKGVISRIQLTKSNWLKHIRTIMDATNQVIKHVDELDSHVVVHCSDGWDRTAQITSLSALCLDPFYRTIKGFCILIEKDWISFGYKFRSRCGHLTKSKAFVDNSSIQLNHTSSPSLLSNMQNKFYQYASAKPEQDKETSPIFHQFLDCTYQLWTQNPTMFEFNEKFLIHLYQHTYSCQFANFLFDREQDLKQQPNLFNSTYSIWSKIMSDKDQYINPIYSTDIDNNKSIIADTRYLKYWSALFCRRDEELNYHSPPPSLPLLPISSKSNSDESFSVKITSFMEN